MCANGQLHVNAQYSWIYKQQSYSILSYFVSTLTMSKIMCYCDGSPKNVLHFSRAMVPYHPGINYWMITIFCSSYDADECKTLTHF